MLAALAEAGTGLILLACPPIVVRLLFGAEIDGAGFTMSRLAGIALIGLGVACWPGTDSVAIQRHGDLQRASDVVSCVVGVHGEVVGLLLWPAVVVHAILVVLLVVAVEKTKDAGGIRA